MEELFENIVSRIDFKKQQKFAELLPKCIHISADSSKSTYAMYDNLMFKMDVFFKGFENFQNEYGKDKKYLAACHALGAIFEELGCELDKEELFILYHIKDLGKFRKREKDLHDELKKLWANYPYQDFAQSDQDFSHSLKILMRMRLIDYRRGNLHAKQSVIIRFRNREE